MTVEIHYRSIIFGFLTVVLALASGTVYVWLVAAPLEPSGRTGQQLLLLLFAPMSAGFCLYYLGRGLHRMSVGITRFAVTARELTVRSPLRVRIIPWSSAQDFLLPPARFPNAPETLVLLLAGDIRLNLPLQRFRAAGAEAIMAASIPGLAEWGLERVRTPMPSLLSPFRVRWQLHKSSIHALYGMPALFLLVSLGAVAMSWEFVNYLRIRQSHVSVSANITEIRKDNGKHETVWARVRYIAWNGQNVRLHRQVALSFADHFKVADQIAVDYLPDHPTIGRIPGWDLDGRQWMMLILVLPVVWVTFRGTQRSVGDWIRPLHERLAWGARPSSPHFGFSGASLDGLCALLPDLHSGAIILKPPSTGLRAWARWFGKSGIEARQALGKFLVLAPNQAKRMLQRAGGPNSFLGGYMVLDCESADDAERVISDQLGKVQSGQGNNSLEHVRFYCLDGAIGPADDAKRRSVFQAWIMQRLRRLYGGKTPPEIPEIHLADLFDIDPADGIYDLLIERHEHGPRIWLRDNGVPPARLAECTRGRWVVIDNVPMPRSLKSHLAKRILSGSISVMGYTIVR